ncbi:MAG: endonuclease/exonuclease/phosphatase family protein [Anaerolineaceae bacterium]|nr:endonuclease/exonuclease/phosphatase family protein [Anaerolineaceae bacterium]
MTASRTRPSHLRRFVALVSGSYLLFMVVYLLARLVFQDRVWPVSLLNTFAHLLFLPLPVLLVAALLVRSRQAVLALLPVLALAGVWFGPRFLPKNVPSDAVPVLRVMTNNVWRLNPTPNRVVDLIRAENPDVVFLQEVQLDTDQDTFAGLAAEYPYRSTLIDEMRLSIYAAVNLTLSKYPFISSEEVDLGLPPLPHIFRDVIEVQGQPVALYNVHLVAPWQQRSFTSHDATYFAQVALDFDDRERNQQLDALLNLLADEPYPYIVAGDFNLSDVSVTYSRVMPYLHDSFAEAGNGFGGSWPMVAAYGWSGWIPAFIRMDYIWHSAGLQAVNAWQGTFVGSDHRPVLAEFSLDS